MQIGQDEIIEYLVTSHLETEGGYPYPFEWHHGDLVIAILVADREIQIEIYTQADLDSWVDACAKFKIEDDGYPPDEWEIIGECRPQKISERIEEESK